MTALEGSFSSLSYSSGHDHRSVSHKRKHHINEFTEFKPGDLTHTHYGLIWVHPRGGAAATDLHGLEDAYRLQDFFHYQSRQLQRRMNWKMVIDTLLESAHFPFLHRDSIASLFIHSLGIFDAFGDHCRMVYPRKTITTLRGTDPRHWDLLRHSIELDLVCVDVTLWKSTAWPSTILDRLDPQR